MHWRRDHRKDRKPGSLSLSLVYDGARAPKSLGRSTRAILSTPNSISRWQWTLMIPRLDASCTMVATLSSRRLARARAKSGNVDGRYRGAIVKIRSICPRGSRTPRPTPFGVFVKTSTWSPSARALAYAIYVHVWEIYVTFDIRRMCPKRILKFFCQIDNTTLMFRCKIATQSLDIIINKYKLTVQFLTKILSKNKD